MLRKHFGLVPDTKQKNNAKRAGLMKWLSDMIIDATSIPERKDALIIEGLKLGGAKDKSIELAIMTSDLTSKFSYRPLLINPE